MSYNVIWSWVLKPSGRYRSHGMITGLIWKRACINLWIYSSAVPDLAPWFYGSSCFNVFCFVLCWRLHKCNKHYVHIRWYCNALGHAVMLLWYIHWITQATNKLVNKYCLKHTYSESWFKNKLSKGVSKSMNCYIYYFLFSIN